MTINVTEKVIFRSETIIHFRIVVRKAKVIGEKNKQNTTKQLLVAQITHI